MNTTSPKLNKLREMREEAHELDLPGFLNRKTNGLKPLPSNVPLPRAPGNEPPGLSAADVTRKETKLKKSRGRIAKMKAKQSGATTAMPLTGKAALAAIRAATQSPATVRDQTQQEKPMTNKTKTTSKKKPAAKAKPKAKPAAKAKTAKKPAATKKSGDVKPGTKLAIVAGLLTRPEGCTTAEILKGTGWPSVSVPQQAKAAGLTLSKEKDGKVSRYRGAAA